MIQSIREDTVKYLFAARLTTEIKRQQVAQPIATSHGDDGASAPVKREKKVGRNDDCPCGSGKKYKKCCGAK